MYIFNKITVNPQLPKPIEKMGEVAENLWWSWNTEFLKIFKEIDIDLWERCNQIFVLGLWNQNIGKWIQRLDGFENSCTFLQWHPLPLKNHCD